MDVPTNVFDVEDDEVCARQLLTKQTVELKRVSLDEGPWPVVHVITQFLQFCEREGQRGSANLLSCYTTVVVDLHNTSMASAIISKKRKFVADGVFTAELNEFFTRELAAEGYSGCLVRVNHVRTEIIIRATHTQEVLGDKGRRLRELTALVRQRFRFPEGSLELYAEKVMNRGLHAVAQCESLRNKLLGGLPVRRAAYGVLRYVMESGAKGCEVIISGKLRAARAKSMKFNDGFMIHTGQPAKDFVDHATRHVLMKQGVLGIKVKIMHGWDPEGRTGRPFPLPDAVTIIEPKEDEPPAHPVSEARNQPQAPAQAEAQQAAPAAPQAAAF